MQETALARPQPAMVIKPWVLFIPYIQVPIILAIAVLDFLFNFGLKEKLPNSIQHLIVLTFILQYPHVIASSLIFLDSEYWTFYKKKILIRFGVVLAISASLLYFAGFKFYLLAYALWDMHHVVKQQIGIGRMLNKQTSRNYEVWGFLTIVISIFMASWIGFYKSYSDWIPQEFLKKVLPIAGVLCATYGIWIMTRLKEQRGQAYLFINSLLLFTLVVCYVRELYFFILLMPRIIHDFTAFIFYVVHDTNRNTPEPRQWIYKKTRAYLPIWAVCIGLSMLLGLSIKFWESPYAMLMITVFTSIHFTTEAFTWKGKTLHRKHLFFKLS